MNARFIFRDEESCRPYGAKITGISLTHRAYAVGYDCVAPDGAYV